MTGPTHGREDGDPRAEAAPDRTRGSASAERVRQQHLWVDLQVQQAMERGDFDDLPGAGKPIEDLGSTHDPEWWVKRLIEREQITGVAPAAIGLRREDATFAATLDEETTETGVRRVVEDFNRRIVEARRQLTGGPPVVTPTRDTEVEIAAWHARRDQRRRLQRELLQARDMPRPARSTRRWPRGRSRRRDR